MLSAGPIVTIFGGSGFVGRYIAQRMARAGWRVRVAVRRPNEALFVRTYGTVGQVEPMQANVRDEASVRRAIAGAQAVVNCVGVLVAHGRQTFDALQAEGAGRIARAAADLAAERLVHISAIGADPESPSEYARTKAAGEAAVTAAFPGAVIVRPSIMFGFEDKFFNRFAGMARWTPVLPLIGAESRFQPVYVDDVAKAVAKAVTEGVEPGVYELGGPQVETFRELMQRMLRIIRRRRAILSLSFRLGRLQARFFDFLQRASLGLFVNRLITVDQVEQLGRDNVVGPEARGFAELGITPTPMDAVLDLYLYRFRTQGQFASTQPTVKGLGQE